VHGNRLIAALAGSMIAAAAGPASGQGQPEPGANRKPPEMSPEAARQAEEPADEPLPEDDAPIDDAEVDATSGPDPAAPEPGRATDASIERSSADPEGQELSGTIGVELGGRVSPGGLHLGGAYLYQLSERDWFDGGLAFTLGGGGRACFQDRDGETICDHGVTAGFGGEVAVGVRRYFPGQGNFTPYARVALALRLVSYGGDDVRGFAIPLEAGGGVRAKVSDRVSVVGAAELRLGPAWFNSGLGAEPHLGLAVHAAAELRL
jgi:hypothetical protein